MSELSTWIFRTLGHDNWPKHEGEVRYPGQREINIVAHYEREISKGRLTLPQAYERATSDLQGRCGNDPKSKSPKPQRGKNYRAVQVHIAPKEEKSDATH